MFRPVVLRLHDAFSYKNRDFFPFLSIDDKNGASGFQFKLLRL